VLYLESEISNRDNYGAKSRVLNKFLNELIKFYRELFGWFMQLECIIENFQLLVHQFAVGLIFILT